MGDQGTLNEFTCRCDIPCVHGAVRRRLLFPVAGISAIVAEMIVFKLLNRPLGLAKLLGLVVLANVVSGAFGFLITPLFPTGLVAVPHGNISILDTGPLWGYYVLLSFIPAWAMSIVIEYYVVRALARWVAIPRPFWTVAWANTASYLVLFGLAAFWAFVIW